jgi:hypothetical protein
MLRDPASLSKPANAALRFGGATVAVLLLLGASQSQAETKMRPGEKAYPEAYSAMAPAGSTPDQIRQFCTNLATTTADKAFANPAASTQRANAATTIFRNCMQRHNLTP